MVKIRSNIRRKGYLSTETWAADHPLQAWSRFLSSDRADRTAARLVSRAVGYNIWKIYQEPYVDPVFWDFEIEHALLAKRGKNG